MEVQQPKNLARQTFTTIRDMKIAPDCVDWAGSSSDVRDVKIAKMMRVFRRVEKCLLVVALCASCFAFSGCVESTFTLDGDSRLPRWFTLPPELTRRDVSVTLTYYTWGPAKFTLKDWKGKKLAVISGKEQSSSPLHLTGNHGFYPAYEVISANGITEIIEHRKPEPIFYVSDDPVVREELLGVTSSGT